MADQLKKNRTILQIITCYYIVMICDAIVFAAGLMPVIFCVSILAYPNILTYFKIPVRIKDESEHSKQGTRIMG